jgi:3-deoxy-manno-octulosonate cytidylyltransferase (CMP-KDO synthetase)
MHKAVAIIPARFDSTRFPGKPLAVLNGKPLIQHVYEQVAFANLIDTIFVATDDKKIFDAVTSFGGRAVMTSPKHTSGTDRVAEVARDIDCDIIVNVQGDEPFIKPEMVDDVIKLLNDDQRASISTLAKRTADIKEILSPNVVKVIMDNEGFAMYFSRSPIPYYRDIWQLQIIENIEDEKMRKWEDEKSQPLNLSTSKLLGFSLNSKLQTFYCYKHIGIYGFRKDALMDFSGMGRGRLEMIERLEQLRALASGIKIKVKETPHDTFGIDTIEDLRKAEEWQNLSL